jgi:hypothetical protein
MMIYLLAQELLNRERVYYSGAPLPDKVARGHGTSYKSGSNRPFYLSRSFPMSALAPLIENYLAGVKTLSQAVAGMTPAQLTARPVPGKWSTLEVVCHLADFDPILADRMKRILAEDRPQLLGADEKRFAAALAYHDRDVQEELAIITQTRAQMGRILRQQKDDVLKRVGVHNERGELSLERMLNIATNHIPHHVKFIQEKRQALGLPT